MVLGSWALALRPSHARAVLCLVLLAFLCAPVASAQDVHLLVVAGVGGDEEHVKKFDKWSLAVLDAAKKRGVLDANVMYLGENPIRVAGG
jgi:hypothetical protein